MGERGDLGRAGVEEGLCGGGFEEVGGDGRGHGLGSEADWSDWGRRRQGGERWGCEACARRTT